MEMQKLSIPKIIFPAAFTYSRIYFSLKFAGRAVVSSFKGSMLRGLLGTALKKLNCNEPGPCRKCNQVKTCAYSNLFKPELVMGNQLAVPPFVIYSPTVKEEFREGEHLEFTITLFGSYARYFDYFLNAFNYASQLGIGKQRTAYEIEEIRDDISGEWIYRDREVNRNWKVAMTGLSEFKGESVKKIRLEFLTPVSLKRDKKLLLYPEIGEVVGGLIRRVHILSRSIWGDREFSISKDFIAALTLGIER
ncbi:MAG: hypothetical protein GY757_07905, partial [bacterium]|nr:hypothetical protein [bacterium]